jgi:hypothetical protein
LVRALLYRLPELVLKAFGNQRNVDFLCAGKGAHAGQCQACGQYQQFSLHIHGVSPAYKKSTNKKGMKLSLQIHGARMQLRDRSWLSFKGGEKMGNQE